MALMALCPMLWLAYRLSTMPFTDVMMSSNTW